MAAPKGNKFALGGSGNKKLFDSPEQLQQFIDDYFNDCDANPLTEQNWVGKEGFEVLKNTQRPYTVEGLCLHLGIDRKTLLNYQKAEGYEEFFHVITRAKQKITDQYVTFGLAGGYNFGLIKFLLTNNTEYKEKIENQISGELSVNSGVENMSTEEILKRAEALRVIKQNDPSI